MRAGSSAHVDSCRRGAHSFYKFWSRTPSQCLQIFDGWAAAAVFGDDMNCTGTISILSPSPAGVIVDGPR